jgi:hypothetical protein
MIVSLQDSGIKTILQYIHHYQFIIKGPKCCACHFPKHDISIKHVSELMKVYSFHSYFKTQSSSTKSTSNRGLKMGVLLLYSFAEGGN